MQYHKQIYRHDPDNGIYGDCERTTLACLLDLNPEDVPHFAQQDHENMIELSDKWLLGQGYRRIQFGLWPDLGTTLKAMAIWNPGIPYRLVGLSPRNTCHVVIAKGGEIIHDTAIDGGGLVGPAPETGVYWVEFIVSVPGVKEPDHE